MAVALASMSSISIFLVYTSFQSTEARINLVASQEVRKEMSQRSDDVAQDIESNLSIITRRLETAATSPLLQQLSPDNANALLAATVVGKEYYVERINYLDKDGTLLYTTDEHLSRLPGSDLSDRIYYETVSERNQPVLTGPLTGLDNRTSISVAVPVTDSAGNFNGLLAAIMHVDSIIERANSKLYSFNGSQVFIVSVNGTIIGPTDQSLIGRNISGELGTSQNDIIVRNMQLMASGKSGVFEYTQDGTRKLAAYSPIAFSGMHTWSAFVTAPASQTEEFSIVLSDQRSFTVIAIVLISIIAVIFMTFILTLNNRLYKTVHEQNEKIRSQLIDLHGAYEKLKEQDTIKDEFINIAAHELRTPVLPIVLSAEGLADDLGTNNKVDIILRNAKRLNKLTNDILDVSRIKSNTFKLQKDNINVRKLIEEAIEDVLLKAAEGKNLNLKVSFESKLAEGSENIVADRGRLNQVLSNLLYNAVNFTDEGTITVTFQHSSRLPGFVEVIVADTGKGIDPSIKPRLFEKFVTKSEKAKGTGLGLYLCKAIIEAHGGQIWAEDNSAEGKGAVFTFALPASA